MLYLMATHSSQMINYSAAKFTHFHEDKSFFHVEKSSRTFIQRKVYFMERKGHTLLCREKFISCREKFTHFYSEKKFLHVEKSSRNFYAEKSLFHVEKSSRTFMQRKVYFM